MNSRFKNNIKMGSEIPRCEEEILKILNLNPSQYSIENNHVVEINLPNRHLQALPRNFWNLKHLQKIVLISFNLKNIPPTLITIPELIGDLEFLQELIIGNYHLEDIPESIGNLVNLKTLILFNNQLKSIPESIKNLVNLQSLSLYGNSFKSVPQVIGSLGSLQELHLGSNQFTSIPEFIGDLVNLKILSLEQSQFTLIPESIENLVNLQVLSLNENKFTSVPEPIGTLINLQELYLDSNQLTSIPECIGNLVNLRLLNLNENKFTSIPEPIGALKNLQILYLERNQITSIPEFIGDLVNLKTLFFYDNQLTSVPPNIKNLINLERIFLSYNNLTYVPIISNTHNHCLIDYEITNNPIKTLSKYAIDLLENNSGFLMSFNSLTKKAQQILISCIKHYNYAELHEYYKKTLSKLVLDYINDFNSLNQDEFERLIHEAGKNEIDILQNNLSLKDPILQKILKNSEVKLSNGLKILL